MQFQLFEKLINSTGKTILLLSNNVNDMVHFARRLVFVSVSKGILEGASILRCLLCIMAITYKWPKIQLRKDK